MQFIVSARKTSRLVEELKAADWKRRRAPMPMGMRVSLSAGGLGESLSVHRPALPEEAQAHRRARAVPVVRHAGVQLSRLRDQHEEPIDALVWFYNQRAGAENLIKEANNDAGLAAHPSGRWMMNCNHFQLAMLAYNLNCWLMLFNREEGAKVATLKHTTLATARLRFLFLAAKIWRHAGESVSATAITTPSRVSFAG